MNYVFPYEIAFTFLREVNMLKVLFYAEELSVGGVEKMMLQWTSYIVRDIRIDLVVNKVGEKSYIEAFEALGCKVFISGCKTKDILGKYKFLKKLLSSNHYDIIHVHTSMATDFFVPMLAKRKGIRNRIVHSHNVPVFFKWSTCLADKMCKPLLRLYTTDYYGCSKDSIFALFGRRLENRRKIINNGIDTELFLFSEEKWRYARSFFSADSNCIVIGSVGRLDYQKDYGFLLSIIDAVQKKRPQMHIKVVILGEGEERTQLECYAKEHMIELMLPGNRSDINVLLCGFDLFVLPSRYEGFPVVLVEAQANGLSCVTSTAVPEEVALLDSFRRIDKKQYDQWVSTIIDCIVKRDKHNNTDRKLGAAVVKRNGYDIRDCAFSLLSEYKRIASR